MLPYTILISYICIIIPYGKTILPYIVFQYFLFGFVLYCAFAVQVDRYMLQTLFAISQKNR